MAESLSEVVLPARYSPRDIGVGRHADFLYPYSGCCSVPLRLVKSPHSGDQFGTFKCSTCTKAYFSPTGKYPIDLSATEQVWLGLCDPAGVKTVRKIISCWTGIDFDELEVTIDGVS